jgi:predicted NBD/HSP70 family sugar kinase
VRTKGNSTIGLSTVLEEICRRGETPLADMAERLGAKVSTLESKLRDLETRKLVRFAKGRKAVSLNPDFGSLMGIDMGASHLHYALTDFSGEMMEEANKKIRPEDGPKRLIGQIKLEIQHLAMRRGRSRLRGLAIGVPGPIDPRTGLVSLANNLPGWVNVDLKGELEREFRVPVALENDANMAAVGEHWRGVAQEEANFIFIALGTGIGSGIFVHGKLYRGRTGAAGELYRLHLEWPRWNEDFGENGFFESHASGQGIATLGRRLMGCAGAAKNLAEERDAYFVFDAFRRGNPQARETLETIFTILATGIANVVAVLDPDMVVLGGGVTKGAPEFMLSTVETVARHIQPNLPPVRLSALEDKAQTYGAIFSAMTAACEAVLARRP